MQSVTRNGKALPSENRYGFREFQLYSLISRELLVPERQFKFLITRYYIVVFRHHSDEICNS